MAPHHPSLINHPCHSKHPLSLLSAAPYPDGIFNCDACNRSDTGFCYHCKECNVDLHIHCASLPLSLNHNSHPQHPLSLTFLIPYPTNDFSCDICKNTGSKCWLYRCNACLFDVHLNCATGSASIQRSVSAQTPQSQPMFQHQSSLPVHKQQKGLNPMLQNHNSFPHTTQAWTKPAPPTGYNFAPNQQPNYYPMNNNNPAFVAPALRVQQTNQQPNYYAMPMNNNQPAFGAPAMGVPTMGVQQTNFQNQPANFQNQPSMGVLMAQGFCEGMGQQAGQTFMQGILGSAASLGGGNGNVDASSGSFFGVDESSSGCGDTFSME
ncbi:hypothetical protein MKW94_005548 [Papaver nudicaule]|uniref:DC1 domain-containing protein n=1 Tax=Papaver nudicaule TaxID=74823 RepID=A0AA41SDW9_PAPNU|nr:hypothetical protein [Papaver nudicaule]